MSYDGSNGINCLDTENDLINPTVQRIFSGSYIRPISSVILPNLNIQIFGLIPAVVPLSNLIIQILADHVSNTMR